MIKISGCVAALAVAFAPAAHADIGAAGFLDGSTQALIMGASGIPTPSQGWLDTFDTLYLQPQGFDGTVAGLTTPELYTGWDPSIVPGEADLINAVTAEWDAGDFGVTDPLTIVGYSQSADIASLVEPTLADDGIPSDALRFLLVGDPASTQGGILTDFAETPFGTWLFDLIGAQNFIGNTTPDNLYPTEVVTVTGDPWADFNAATFFSDQDIHDGYLGLTPEMLNSATQVTDGLTEYLTVATPPDLLETLWTALLNDLGI